MAQLIGLGLENFRVFKEYTEFDFAPITLLTGANNSGKSSLIKALLLLAYNAEKNLSRFKLDFEVESNLTKLGDFESIINGEDKISFKLLFDNLNKKFERPVHHEPNAQVFFEEWSMGSFILSFAFNGNKKENMQSISFESRGRNKAIFDFTFSEDAKTLESKWINYVELEKYFYRLEERDDMFDPKMLKELNHNELNISNIKNIDGIIDLAFRTNGNDTIQKKYHFSILNDILKELLRIAFESFQFGNQIDYLPAFRANQERFYSSGSDLPMNRLLKQFTDEEFAEESPEKEFINFWINEFGVGERIEIIAEDGGTRVNIINGSKRPIADYGFGITQYLTLLLKIVLSPNKILIIEEGENSLHPNFQAKIAELLIDAHRTFEIRFIVETHSEYFLNRLRLLIVKKEIAQDLLKVYFLRLNEEGNAEKFDIDFKENGGIGNAPPEFFETYLTDSMEITLNAQ